MIRCRWPRGTGVPGSVTSTLSVVSARSRSARSSLACRSADRPSRASRGARSALPGLAVADLAQRLLAARSFGRGSGRAPRRARRASCAPAIALSASVSSRQRPSIDCITGPRSAFGPSTGPSGWSARDRGGCGASGVPGLLPTASIKRNRDAVCRVVTMRDESSLRPGPAARGAEPYDPIARIYDPWSRSVVEDVAFYVAEARKARRAEPRRAARRRARRRHRPDRDPDRGRGRPGDRRRLVGRDARGLPRAAPRDAGVAGARSTSGSATSRDPPVDERVPLVICPFRAYLHLAPTPTAPDRARAPPTRSSCPAAGSSSTSSRPAREDIEETNGRWLEREPGIWERADWDEAARRLTLSVRDDDDASRR